MGNFIVQFGIPLAYIALGIAAVTAIVFPVIFMLQDVKKAKWAIIGFLAVIVLFLVCFLIADGNQVSELATKGQLRMVEASMYTFYLMLTVAIVSILYSTISGYFK